MVPIVFGAGVLLGLLAWSSGSLIPGMIGHVVMDIGPVRLLVDRYRRRLYRADDYRYGRGSAIHYRVSAFTISLFMVLFVISRLRGRLR